MECNRRPAQDGKTMCEICARKWMLRCRAHRHDRIANGLCVDCGSPVLDFRRNGKRYASCSPCRIKRRKGNENWRPKHPEYQIARRQQYWDQVFAHYGQVCACCGETERAFLTIDHVNNNGREHRKQVVGVFLQWIIRQGFPTDLQILCFNCNCATGRVGQCPHETARRREQIRAV